MSNHNNTLTREYYDDDSDDSNGGKDKKKSLPFTKREIKFLHKGVSQFGLGSWEKILKEFNFQEGRTAVSCRKKFLYTQDNPPRTLDSESDDDVFPQPKRSKKPIAFTRQEIQWVWEGVQTHGTNWRKILCSYQFQPGRTAKSLEHKYYRFIKKNPPGKDGIFGENRPSGRFSEDECKYLTEGVAKYGENNWERILSEYAFDDGRTAKDLKEKYEFLEAQRNASLLNGTDPDASENMNDTTNRVMDPSAMVNPIHSSSGVVMNTGLGNYSSLSGGMGGLGVLGGLGPPMEVKSPIISSSITRSLLGDGHDYSANPTPITPLSPYDDDPLLGSSFTSNTLRSEISQPITSNEELKQLATQPIDDFSDYESDYEEYEPTPSTVAPVSGMPLSMSQGMPGMVNNHMKPPLYQPMSPVPSAPYPMYGAPMYHGQDMYLHSNQNIMPPIYRSHITEEEGDGEDDYDMTDVDLGLYPAPRHDTNYQQYGMMV